MDLIRKLFRVSNIVSENGFLRALNSTHPNSNDRIAKLQELGTNYYAY